MCFDGGSKLLDTGFVEAVFPLHLLDRRKFLMVVLEVHPGTSMAPHALQEVLRLSFREPLFSPRVMILCCCIRYAEVAGAFNAKQ